MLESRRCGAFVGRVADGRVASWCRQPMGRCSRFHPCMSGLFGVGRLACGLLTVGLFFLQQFVWYPAVSAALWSAGASRGRLRCSPRRCSRVFVLVVFPVSSEVCCVRPAQCGGRGATGACPTRCVGSSLSLPPVVGSFGAVGWPVWAWPAAFGRCRLSLTSFGSRQACVVVVRPAAVCPRVRLLHCCQHCVGLGRRLCRLKAGLSWCRMRWAALAV